MMIDLDKKHGRLGPYLAKHPGLFGLYTKVSTATSNRSLLDHGTLVSFDAGSPDDDHGPTETGKLPEDSEKPEDHGPYGRYKPREILPDFEPKRSRPFETPRRSTIITAIEVSSAESLRFETPPGSAKHIVVSGRSSIVSRGYQSPSPRGPSCGTPIRTSRLRFSLSDDSSSSSGRDDTDFAVFDRLLDRIEDMLSQCRQHSFVMSYSGPTPFPQSLAKSLTGLRTYQDMVLANLLVLLTKPHDSIYFDKIKSNQTWLTSPDPKEDQESNLWAAHFTALRFLRLQIEKTHFDLTLGLIGLVTATAAVKHLAELVSQALSPIKPRASVIASTPSRPAKSPESSTQSTFSHTVPLKARALLGIDDTSSGTPRVGRSPRPRVPVLCFEPATPPDKPMDVDSPASKPPTSNRLRRMPKFSTPSQQEDPFVTPIVSSSGGSSSAGTVNFRAPPPSTAQEPQSSPVTASVSTACEEPTRELASPVIPPWGAQSAVRSPRNELALRQRQRRLAALERELGKMAEEMAQMAEVELVTIEKVLKGKGFLPT